ncbi:MAG: NAD-dependent epimerase/dehydratase family protein [Acidobacteriota bacterium]|nr:NAD-dependent epimerase/dehydratase family protein [Acidobacteriota bacterium]
MSRVLVTGGAGFIGSHVCALLAEGGHEAVVVDPLLTYAYTFEPRHWYSLQYRREVLLKDARVVVASTESRDELRRVMRESRPEYVVHLGVLPLATVARVRSDHAFESMLRGTFNLIDVALDAGLEKFLYVSSSMVYGDFTQMPMPEDGITAPKDPYGGFKLAGEIVVQTYSRAQGLPYAIVRPSAVYGPTDMNDRIVQRFVECALWNRPLTVVDPDNTWLDFSYVKDVADGLVKALLSPVVNETFNITAGEGHTLSELYALLRERYPNMPVEVAAKAEDFRPKRGALDVAKARRVLGYEPRYTLAGGVEEYLAFLSSMPERAPVLA